MLIWKQWLIEKRNPFKSTSEVSLPILVSLVLLFVNTFYSTTQHKDALFLPYKTGIGSTNFSNTTELIYCPNSSTFIRTVINRTSKLLGIVDVVGFANINAMEVYVQNEVVQERLFGAIEFYKTTPKLVVALRFPEFRAAQGYNTTWSTESIFPPSFGLRADMAESNEDIGPAPHYQRKGFLMLQEALSQAYIEYIRPKQNKSIPDIYMQRHPLPSWKSRSVYSSKETIFNIVLFMFLSYILLFVGVIKLVTLEKELQIKQALETAGVSVSMLWFSYFIRSIILFIFCFSVLLFALNVPAKQSLILFSDNLIVFLFFFCFSLASIALAFLISVLQSSTVAAATGGAMVWFVSFLPFYQLQGNSFGGVAAYFFSPLAFFNAFNLILAFESSKQGLQWQNLWIHPTPSHPYCFGYILLSLILCAIFYLVLALCIENGQFKKLWSCCKNCIRRKRQNQRISTFDDIIQEQPPSNLPLTVKTLNLCKVFSNKFTAIENISIEMYEDQITVLLGPNGAGKTTTGNIIVGIMKPTQGFIRIYKSNVWKLLGEDQTYIGYCPQTDILFEELTVEEHIYFYSRIKGFDMINSIEEADKYITLLQLSDKATTAARYLTEGLRRRLSIALALCAQSKLVVFDEPTAGVDPISKRAIWNLLSTAKKDRTILITTHLIEEAELLGDRIAILCEGVLKCCGSSTFLKKQYAKGYSLMVVKGKDCSTKRVHNLIKKHAQNITVASDVGGQLSFKLENLQSTVIENMLRDLEEQQKNLEIQTFRISMPTLEEVFRKNTVDYVTVPMDQVEEKSVDFLEGYKLFFNRILALLLKKYLLFKASWVLLLLHVIFVLLLVLISEIAMYQTQTYDMPNLKIDLATYDKPVVLTDGEDNQIKASYKRIVEQSKGRVINTKDISATIFAHMNKDRTKVLHRYPVAATFYENNTIIAWYNNFPYHTAPLALNLIMNALIGTLRVNGGIEIYNDPLPFTNLQKALRTETSIYGSLQYLVAVFSSVFIIFVIREAYTRSMRQQFVCGIHPAMYWLMTLFCDFILYMVVAALALITLMWLPDKFIFSHIWTLFLILLCYGFASLSMSYLIHRIFSKASTGYVTKILVCTAGIMLATILQYAGKIMYLSEWFFYGFSFLPTFSLANALYGLNRFSDIDKVCTMLYASCVKFSHEENCTNLISEVLTQAQSCERSYYSMNKFGFLLYLVALLLFGTLYILLNIIIDTSLIPRTLNRYQRRKYRQDVHEEEDVIREREWVRKASTKEISERSVVLKDVSKTYKRKIALNRVSLAMSNYECFGLIGTHGAGKTTIFKILTGETYAYTGDAIIKGLNVNKHMTKIRTMTVYCPQIDGLINHLTGQQNLILYALIQGVPYKTTREVADVYAQKLNLQRHLQKTVHHYGVGNKRKLSTAIALMGNTEVILLDDPSAGMDISTAKHLWMAICKEREKGKTVLVATHSMEECEALCDRIGILVKGKMICIGSTHQLTKKFAKDYILTIRCKKIREDNVGHKKLMDFVKANLPTAELLESFKEVYAFQIRKEQSVSCATLFHIMDSHKTALNIEDFILSQSSLEQVFLSVS